MLVKLSYTIYNKQKKSRIILRFYHSKSIHDKEESIILFEKVQIIYLKFNTNHQYMNQHEVNKLKFHAIENFEKI